MALNFRKWFEKIFKSFDVAGDTKLIEKLESDWNRFLMLVKRHWIYSILHSWRVFLVIIIWFINVYLLVISNQNLDIISIVIAVFLFLSITYWVIVVLMYIYRFYKIQWSYPYIEDIYSCIKRSKDSDLAFTKFFNQTIFLLVVLFFITLFTTVSSIISILSWWALSFWFGILNSFLLIFQLTIFYSYLSKMINQEMDFKIIVPWQIIFYNQRWLLWDNQTMNSNKIKTMNSSYRWLLGSFFNYWDIVVLSEWDQKDNWEMTMDYIWFPSKTLKEMEKVLNKDFESMEKDVNVLLKKFKSEIWIDNIDNDENKLKLREYVRNNEEKIKKIFDWWDEETKKEVKELYVLITKDLQ